MQVACNAAMYNVKMSAHNAAKRIQRHTNKKHVSIRQVHVNIRQQRQRAQHEQVRNTKQTREVATALAVAVAGTERPTREWQRSTLIICGFQRAFHYYLTWQCAHTNTIATAVLQRRITNTHLHTLSNKKRSCKSRVTRPPPQRNHSLWL